MLTRNGKALRVLIVEDHALIALDLKTMVEDMGGAVIGLPGSGERGVALARELDPDIVLMDIHLAGLMDGVEASQAITARSDTPVIFVTGNTDTTTMARIRRAGDHVVLPKPVLPAELKQALATACDLDPPALCCAAAMWQVSALPQRGRRAARRRPRAESGIGLGATAAAAYAAARLEYLGVRESLHRQINGLQAVRTAIAARRDARALARRH